MKQAPPCGTAGASTRSPPRLRAKPRDRANPSPTPGTASAASRSPRSNGAQITSATCGGGSQLIRMPSDSRACPGVPGAMLHPRGGEACRPRRSGHPPVRQGRPWTESTIPGRHRRPASGGARSLGSGPKPLGKASESHLFCGNSRKVLDKRYFALVLWCRSAARGHLSPGAAMDGGQA